MASKYEKLIPKVLKEDKIMSTNQVREALKDEGDVNYIEFNLVFRLLEKLAREGKIERLEDVKRSVFWRKK